MNRTTIVLICALLALSAPAASAWTSHGEKEPNTGFDGPDFMPQGAPTGYNNVYLNAVGFTADALGASGVNPNTAAAGSRIQPAGTLYWAAFFGAWTDCNGDGAIGMADSALQEYRAELLSNDDVCPTGESAHNDGEWVIELLTIGMIDPCNYLAEDDARRDDANDPCFGAGVFIPRPGVLYVNGTNLWADQGAPGEELAGTSCPIRPAPWGTFSNTGLMLRFADCFTNFRVAQTVNDNDATGMLAFEDPKNPQDSTSPLNQNLPVSPFGNPYDNDRTGVLEQTTETDDAEPTATVADCAGGPSTAADPTDASAYQAVSDVYDSLTQLNAAFDAAEEQVNSAAVQDALDAAQPGDNEVHFERNDCDRASQNEIDSTYFGQNVYGQDLDGIGLVEGANNPGNAGTGKLENDFTYGFYDGGYDMRSPANQAVIGVLGESTPGDDVCDPCVPTPDMGVSNARFFNGPLWTGDTIYVSTPQSVNRNTLEPNSRGYWTTYAAIDKTAFGELGLVTPGIDHVYGSDNCGSETEGVVNGWNCDSAAWWKDAAGADTRPTYQDGTLIGAVVGDPYQFRDVDCYDGTLVSGLPVRLSATDVSPRGICDTSTPLPAV